MRTAAIAAVLLTLFATAQAEAAGRSVSTSRQFIVYGEDVRLRGVLCDLAEQTKDGLLTILKERDEWKVPVVVNAESRQANLPEAPVALLRVSQTGGGLKVQVDFTLGTELPKERIERELLRATLVELMYRNAQQLRPGSRYVDPPGWLLNGLVGLQAPSDRSTLGQVLAAAFPPDARLTDVIEARDELLDVETRKLHRAGATALVRTLVSGPDGNRHLAQYIRDLPNGSIDPFADLCVHFPELTKSEGGIAKAWRAEIARYVATEAFLPLGLAATRKELDRLLVCEIPAADGKAEVKRLAIDEFGQILRERSGRIALARTAEALLLFEPRANPVYHDVVVEYHQIASLLARGNRRRVPQRLARAREWRSQIAVRMGRVDDYLNWFEATQATGNSGLFTRYGRAAASAEESPRRRDRISVYLDALAAQTAD